MCGGVRWIGIWNRFAMLRNRSLRFGTLPLRRCSGLTALFAPHTFGRDDGVCGHGLVWAGEWGPGFGEFEKNEMG